MSTLQDPMTQLWLKVSVKGSDGNRIITWKNDLDLDLLYYTGFVDTDKFTLEQWKQAHQPFKQKNGSYILKLQDWMGLKPYRYDGLVADPFNAMTLKEELWSLKDFEDMIQKFFLPSIIFTKEQFLVGFKKVEPEIKKDGYYKITPSFKKELQYMLENYPSPRRMREISVWNVKNKGKEIPQNSPAGSQKSSFEQGPSASSLTTQKLNQLLYK